MKKLLILLLPLFFFACKEEDDDKFISGLLKDFFAENEPQGITLTTHTDSQAVIINGEHATLRLPLYFVDENNSNVTGTVQIEFKELYHPSDFIFAGKPTITDDGKLLESAGSFYIRATQNGNPLKLRGNVRIDYNPWQVYNPADNRDYSNMELYYGNKGEGQNFAWVDWQNQGTFTGVFGGNPSLSGFGLIVGITDSSSLVKPEFENVDWINCDDVLSDTLPTTSVTVSINGSWQGVADANVYIIVSEVNSVMWIPYNPNGNNFISPSNFPVSFTATVVVMATTETEFYFGTQDITIAPTNDISVTINATSEVDMLAAIKALDD